MLRLFSLLLPCLIPSWRFFKTVEPSPRVQWRVLANVDDPLTVWRDYRPRPDSVPLVTMIKRLFWNPDWNETLFMVSLSERLTIEPSSHSLREIRRRIASELTGARPDPDLVARLQFRLIYVSREDDQIITQTTYVSDPFARDAPIT